MARLFKVWNMERSVRKAVVSDNIASLIEKARLKLGITDTNANRLFDEADGTEIDDDECLEFHDNSRILVIGAEWKPAVASVELTATSTASASSFLGSPASSSSAVDPQHISSPVASSTQISSPVDSNIESPVDSSVEFANESWFDSLHEDFELEELQTTRSHESSEDKKTAKGENTLKRSLMEDILHDDGKRTKHDGDVQTHSITFKLMNDKFRRAKQKGLKVYTSEEINSKTRLEKMRRQFWNEKAELLASRAETSRLDKTTISGLIDTAWTLRKTSLLLDDAHKLKMDERDLFGNDEVDDSSASWRRASAGNQKSTTTVKNLDRLEAANQEVLDSDKRLEKINKDINSLPFGEERKTLQTKQKELKTKFDGSYTELKRAQDALTKSLKVKRNILDKLIKEKHLSKNV